jgi:hypothetical protein
VFVSRKLLPYVSCRQTFDPALAGTGKSPKSKRCARKYSGPWRALAARIRCLAERLTREPGFAFVGKPLPVRKVEEFLHK